MHLGLGVDVASPARGNVGSKNAVFFQAMGQRVAWVAWEYKMAEAPCFEEAPGGGCVR